MRHLSQKGGINLEKRSSFAISAKHLLKRTHLLSPLIRRQGDAQTACHSDKEKGYRIPFENVPIKPIPPFSVMSCPGELKKITMRKAPKHQNQVATAFQNQAKEHPSRLAHFQ